jgi:hypothetical protein
MTDRAKKLTELVSHTNAPANNLLMIVYQPGLANVENRSISLSNLFANVSTNAVFTGARLNLPSTAVPASAGSAGTAGEIRYDTNYIYICVSTNTWKRATIGIW